ncbi:trafficking protein particle complex subunit 10-like [Oppia nitens]|uniref:trafficking protein particle complex subunit 10-like n=1 Tax=Oppia nitens TaxID=1686743 RepID=UPI0023DAF77C|nr:trafficking protein particle complex subunit 10-like [Oppia nitens]
MKISELTMGTYKHIGRMRFARLIGKELTELYIKMGKPQKAISFLLDFEKVYVREKWPHLLNEIRVLLLKCYEMVGDSRRVFKV